MKLDQSEFTGTLKGKIVDAERRFEKLCADLNHKYKPVAASKNLDVDIEMSRKGYDSFSPYYCSEITFGVAKKDAVPDIHRIVIWECRREFLGFPVKWSLPGSMITGQFLDESYENVALELEKQMKSLLENDKP